MKYTHLKRKWNGGYLLFNEETGEEFTPTRASSLAKAMDDTTNLTKWKLRRALSGMAQRPDLIAMAASHDPDVDKREFNDLAEAAMNVHVSPANYGTAVHRATELADLGQPYNLPNTLRADIRAYRDLIEKWGLVVRPEFVEAIFVNTDLESAGTTDRLMEVTQVTIDRLDAAIEVANVKRRKTGDRQLLPASGRMKPGDLIVLDVKTGRVDFGAGAMPIQLSTYAYADLMVEGNAAEGPLVESPDNLNTFYGLIAHVPVGLGEATMHIVDLCEGIQGAKTSQQVLKWRAKSGPRDAVRMFRGGGLEDSRSKDPGEIDLVAAIQACNSRDDLNRLYQHERHRFDANKMFMTLARDRAEALAPNLPV